MAVLFLSHLKTANHPIGQALTCPVTPALEVDTTAHNSARASAFEILSDTPITAYDIMPYGGAPSFLPSASLLYPRTAWGDNFVVAAPKLSGSGKGWMQLVGQQDGTQVTLVAKSSLPAGSNVPAAAANATTMLTVNAGEVVQWLGGDPAGSVLKSDKPIGVWTGNTYLRVTSQTSPSAGGQDSAHQQLPHVSALGSRYVGTNIVTRLASLQPESIVYQVMGTVDGTTLSYDPAPPAGAPMQLASGQVAEFESSALFTVQSQDDKPLLFLANTCRERSAWTALVAVPCRHSLELTAVWETKSGSCSCLPLSFCKNTYFSSTQPMPPPIWCSHA